MRLSSLSLPVSMRKLEVIERDKPLAFEKTRGSKLFEDIQGSLAYEDLLLQQAIASLQA
jgi:hypothetical protein